MIDLKKIILQVGVMREVRNEDKIDEAVLPHISEPVSDIAKSRCKMETPTLTPKNKHDTARPSVKSHYREDENLD